MVEVFVNNRPLDVLNPEITLVRQVNDVGDISNQNSSYTWAFKVPKTFHNTEIFSGLGLIGSDSNAPYELVYCQILEWGVPIISNGIMQIMATTADEYEVAVKEGIVSFQKLIEGKKMSEDIPMDIRRQRTAATIAASWSNNDQVKFLAGNYGKYPNTDSRNYVPWLNVKYLFDQIFKNFGWTYQMDIPDFSELFITFANPQEDSPSADEYEPAIDFKFGHTAGFPEQSIAQVNASMKNINEHKINGVFVETVLGMTVNGFKAITVGNFSLHVKVNSGSAVFYRVPGTGAPHIVHIPYGFKLEVRLNNHTVETFQYVDTDQDFEFDSYVGVLDVDDIASVRIVPFKASEILAIYGRSEVTDWGDGRITPFMMNGDFKVEGRYAEETGVGRVDAFGDLTVKDFIKEFLVRWAMTAFVDSEKRNIKFVNGSNRYSLEKNTIVPLPDVFAGRIREEYLFGTYGRLNWIKFNHDDDEDYYGDFAFRIENDNLPAENVFFQSKFSNPGRQYFNDIKDTELGAYLPDKPIIPFFNREVDYDEDTDEVTVTYTQKRNMFYLAKAVESPGTFMYIDGQLTLGVVVPDFTGLMFDELTAEYYTEFLKHVNKVRIHTVEVAISAIELSQLDLEKIYYSKDELCYYIINKITYRQDKPSVFEMLKLKI